MESKKRRWRESLVILTFVFIVLAAFPFAVSAQTTAFSYQGHLNNAGSPANGNYEMEFKLFDSVKAGVQVGVTVTDPNVAVINGSFAAVLDFGAAPFDPGPARWLEISARPALSPNPFTIMSPRQEVRSTPYAIQARNAATADNATNALQLGGVEAKQYLQMNGNGSGLTNLNGANITNNTINASALASDTFPNQRNLKLLSQLRWDRLTQRVAVGTGPNGVAFDGENIWVTNHFSNSVTKLRASDGEIQGTFKVGIRPRGVAFDGENIWVANTDSNNVMKLRASDGQLLGTFIVSINPSSVAFDGENIWVTNQGSNNVTKLRASDGEHQGTFAVGTEPLGVAFDGANIWVANYISNNVTRLRASDGALRGTTAVGSGPVGVAFDGANIWVANSNSDNVSVVRASDGVAVGSVAAGIRPTLIAFDGVNFWVTNASSSNSSVTRLRASDGAFQGTYAVGIQPAGVAFDGANIWVANGSMFSNNVTKLPVFR